MKGVDLRQEAANLTLRFCLYYILINYSNNIENNVSLFGIKARASIFDILNYSKFLSYTII